MSQQENAKEVVPLDHLTVSNCYEIAALVEVLVRKGVVTEADLLEAITRLKRKPTPAAQQASSTSSPMPLQLGRGRA